ncbi:hypothetical protein CUJ87_05885 [Paraburkholderia caledonica]|nr:hypothetical protein CUJ87_05885 [Paraburkholderia caledonica]
MSRAFLACAICTAGIATFSGTQCCTVLCNASKAEPDWAPFFYVRAVTGAYASQPAMTSAA